MKKSHSVQRQIQNESVFRAANEKIQRGLERLEKKAKASGHALVTKDTDIPLHFYCECSDEDCKERIVLAPSEYKKIHEDRRQFIVLPGHQTTAIERVEAKKPWYMIVKKFVKPPEKATSLQNTNINNV